MLGRTWVLAAVLLFHQSVHGLLCYSCTSGVDSVCGRYFRYSLYRGQPCSPPGLCAMQRQPQVRGVQEAVVLRGCYFPGQIRGLASSPGCRNWTNSAEEYTALYCFCDTDYCNGAAECSALVPLVLLLTVLCGYH